MARPKLAPDERRDDRLPGLRLTAAERAFIETQAARAGIPWTDYARRRLLGQTVAPARATTDDRLLIEINRVGVNLNQITARFHMTGDLAEDFRDTLTELRRVMALMTAAHGS